MIVYAHLLNNFCDYYHLKKQIESAFVDGTGGQLPKSFLDLPKTEQQLRLKERLKKYSQKVYFSLGTSRCFCLSNARDNKFYCLLQAYKRVLDKPVTELREAGICMRENPFYVDTVRRWAVKILLCYKFWICNIQKESPFVCVCVFLNYIFFSLSRISFDLVQAFGTEGMNTKDLTRFGKGSYQKPRLVEIL